MELSNIETIARDFVVTMIEEDCLRFEDYPDALNYADLICAAYRQISESIGDMTAAE